jgi:lipopolysaccharide export system permease protein
MIGGTLSRYFGMRFLSVVLGIFIALWVLVAMVDYIEMLRRTSSIKDVTALYVAQVTFFRVPYLTEKIMPFAVMVGAMFCYLNLARRLELVVARSAGISAWQFVSPAVFIALAIGVISTTLYNPLSAELRERSARMEADLFRRGTSLRHLGSGFWVRQRSDDDQSIMNAQTSSQKGIDLSRVTVFRFDHNDVFRERIDARRAVLHDGYWRLEDARVFTNDAPPADHPVYELATNLTTAQVQESFASPDTVSFWELLRQIELADNAGLSSAGYRLQFYQLLVQPFYLAAMVLLAASVSLGTARFGGVQNMVLGGMVVGFLLYILSKVTGDLSKAGLMPPVIAASLPPLVGGLTGLIALLYQEDG